MVERSVVLSTVLLRVDDSVIPVDEDDHPEVVLSPPGVEVPPIVEVGGGVELSVDDHPAVDVGGGVELSVYWVDDHPVVEVIGGVELSVKPLEEVVVV